jgi:hypothetical protein
MNNQHNIQTQTFIGPSGKAFELREQTGADDDVLSKMGLMQGNELDVLNQFVAGIIMKIDGSEPVTPAMVKQLGLRDKYAIVIQNRIWSLGPDLIFDYAWLQDGPPTEYKEDLTKFVWDYRNPFPGVNDPDYFSLRIPPYPDQSPTFTITVGENEYRLDYMTGFGEEHLFKAKGQSVNNELLARNLAIQTTDGWETIKSFGSIRARDMAIIRGQVEKADPVPSAEITITNPFTGEVQVTPLLAIKDFFFPTHL